MPRVSVQPHSVLWRSFNAAKATLQMPAAISTHMKSEVRAMSDSSGVAIHQIPTATLSRPTSSETHQYLISPLPDSILISLSILFQRGERPSRHL